MTKRIDTGSPWPLVNNSKRFYYGPSADGGRVGNSDYPLWQVVRASTAAAPLFSYARYNASFSPDNVERLLPGLSPEKIGPLNSMDETRNLAVQRVVADALAQGEIAKASDDPRSAG